MEEKETTVVEEKVSEQQDQDTTVTLTQSELDKKLQGAGDKVRTEYSKKIKELEAKIKELTPVQKSEAELDFEKRLAALEAREKQVALTETLDKAGLPHDFTKYLREDADITAFGEAYKNALNGEIAKRVKSDGYVPKDHKTGDAVTKEEFAKMSYDARERLYHDNPDLYRALVGRQSN